MPIPNVPTEDLRNAMGQFDRELRVTSDWHDWEQNKAHRYAIEYSGQHYPVKQIVSMATGTLVSDFSGGRAAGDANRYVADRGLKVIELRPRNPDWVRDELILALDMYLCYAGNPPSKGSVEIDELSETLNRLARYLGITRGDRFRNASSPVLQLPPHGSCEAPMVDDWSSWRLFAYLTGKAYRDAQTALDPLPKSLILTELHFLKLKGFRPGTIRRATGLSSRYATLTCCQELPYYSVPAGDRPWEGFTVQTRATRGSFRKIL
jgi:hypothetical protein